MTTPAFRVFRAAVDTVEWLSPHFARVTFTSDDLATMGRGGPDQRIKLIFPSPGTGAAHLPGGDDWYASWRMQPAQSRSPMRTYTIRRSNAGQKSLVVDFVSHGDSGPASRWLAAAGAADEVLIVAPDALSEHTPSGAEWKPGGATTILIAGDETAVPAACAIIETLGAEANGAVFLEIPTAEDVLTINSPRNVPVTWLPRGDHRGADYGQLLGTAVRAWASARRDGDVESALSGHEPTSRANNGTDASETTLWDVPDEPKNGGLYAWLAGEAGVITGLRRHLVGELGIDRSRIAFMGYWKLGRPDN